ncbi:MAG: ABC transporter permease [Planctomycetes bacterium]|nr:ABC transporter permease [Planctomycetota bacterium]
MNLLDSITLAFETLAVNKFRATLTMLGVVIGVASVIVLVSIGDGAREYVESQFRALGTNVIIILPGKAHTSGGPPMVTASVNPLTIEDSLALAERCPSVHLVSPIVLGSGTSKYMNRSRSCPIIGTTHEFQEIRNLNVEIGQFLPPNLDRSERRVCVIGRTIRKELFGEENPLGKMMTVAGTKFRVIGIMRKKGMSLGMDLDDLVFIPAGSAEKLFNANGLFEVLVSTRSADQIDRAHREVKELMLRRHDDNEDFTVNNQADMLSVLSKVLGAMTYAVGGIAAISLLVGGIGIMNIMLVSVGERTREIGIRKAVGARRRDILAQFLVESVTLSSFGGVLGMSLGIGSALGAKAVFPAMPIVVSPWTIATAAIFSFAVGVFFGVYPARRAAALNPIDALRYE